MKKISAKEANYIVPRANKIYYFLDKFFLKYWVYEKGNYIYLKGKWRLWVKILFFLPVTLITLIYSLWDGGLKEGIKNSVEQWHIPTIWEFQNFYTDSRYTRMKKVLDS